MDSYDYFFFKRNFIKISEERARFLNPELVEKAGHTDFYICKQFGSKTGLCLAYEFRPDFCRNYPDNLGNEGLFGGKDCAFWDETKKEPEKCESS